MIKKISLGVLALIILSVIIVFIALLFTRPQLPAETSNSYAWLQPGPYTVVQSEFEFLDKSRSTNANRDFPGAAQRTLPTTIWFPEDFAGPYSLIIHSHGFLSSRREAVYLLEHLASYGYVVVAADFPLTSGSAPGGPNINDVSNQPEDVSFLIDSTLALTGTNKPYSGNIDTNRIGIMGVSLGGFSTSLTTYHPRLREPRVRAAISIAGPSANLTKRFYDQSQVGIPFLMIAGTSDRLIDYGSNASVIPDRVTNGALLTIEGGNHIGFVGISEPAFRFAHNADSLACWSVQSNVDQADSEVFTDLFSDEDGIVLDADAPQRCQQVSPPEAGHPGRQHMITQIGVLSFFESVLAASEERRLEAKELLQTHLAREFVEARFELAAVP
ncbi:MAG: putative dienelactone hydrolase [Pseudohongiellaceae bacterium]|jgi:predicted dienelactone hydrolase